MPSVTDWACSRNASARGTLCRAARKQSAVCPPGAQQHPWLHPSATQQCSVSICRMGTTSSCITSSCTPHLSQWLFLYQPPKLWCSVGIAEQTQLLADLTGSVLVLGVTRPLHFFRTPKDVSYLQGAACYTSLPLPSWISWCHHAPPLPARIQDTCKTLQGKKQGKGAKGAAAALASALQGQQAPAHCCCSDTPSHLVGSRREMMDQDLHKRLKASVGQPKASLLALSWLWLSSPMPSIPSSETVLSKASSKHSALHFGSEHLSLVH